MIDLGPDHLKTVRRILAEHVPDCEVRAFGSRVTWTAKEYSDLDLAVIGERRLDMDTLRPLREAFEESDLPFRVDVLDWRAISESFQKVIEPKYEVIQRGKMKRGSGGGEEWKEVRLGDIVDIYDGPHATPKKTDAGPIFLGISNLEGGRLDLSEVEHLSETDFKRWTRRVTPLSGDVVFSYETRIGEVAHIPEGLRCCLGRRMGLLRVKRGRILPKFLLYAYLGREFQETLRARTIHGSTVDRIPLINMPDFPIRIPPLDTQRAIAHILGTLDDKIELNRRMNVTLEAMARALFKSWFVDFDPVRAKMEGRDTGLPEHISRLFPDRFEDSTLGEIPKGWRVGKVADQITLCRNMLNPGESAEELFNHYSIPAFDEGRIPKSELGEEIKSSKFIMPERCALISKLNPRIPRVWLPSTQNRRRSICSTEFLVAVPRIGVSLSFLFSYFSSRFFAAEFMSLATGTSGSHQRVNPDSMLNMTCLIPFEPLCQFLSEMTEPALHRCSLRIAESRTLAAIRDALLPKLISGELRVKDAERFVEKVV